MVRIEIESEVGTSSLPARILVYDGDQLVSEVVAKVELEKGADGGYYQCVKLEKK